MKDNVLIITFVNFSYVELVLNQGPITLKMARLWLSQDLSKRNEM